MSGPVDPAFKQIPKGTTGFVIWRIEVKVFLIFKCFSKQFYKVPS